MSHHCTRSGPDRVGGTIVGAQRRVDPADRPRIHRAEPVLCRRSRGTAPVGTRPVDSSSSGIRVQFACGACPIRGGRGGPRQAKARCRRMVIIVPSRASTGVPRRGTGRPAAGAGPGRGPTTKRIGPRTGAPGPTTRPKKRSTMIESPRTRARPGRPSFHVVERGAAARARRCAPVQSLCRSLPYAHPF